jgi:hypothetical protein
MAGFNGLEIYQIDDVLNGGGLEYGSTYLSKKQGNSTQKAIYRFVELGWSRTYLRNKFKHLNDALLEQWPVDLFIEDYMRHIVESLETVDSIYDNLLVIGITKKVAKHLDVIFSPLKHSCYTNKQLVMVAIEHLLGKGEQLCSPTTKHYYSPNVINTWVVVDNKTPKIMNIPYRCSKNIADYIETTVLANMYQDDYTLFFHATNWSSCISIFSGIEPVFGRRCLDFGQSPGFYMSPNIRDSLEWGEKISVSNPENGIIIFSLPNKFPKSLKYKHLVGDTWTSVTKRSRQCKKIDSKIPEIAKCGLLYGNMVANPEDVRENDTLPVPHKVPKQQLVSKRSNADDFIHKHIVGCLFFQKYV